MGSAKESLGHAVGSANLQASGAHQHASGVREKNAAAAAGTHGIGGGPAHTGTHGLGNTGAHTGAHTGTHTGTHTGGLGGLGHNHDTTTGLGTHGLGTTGAHGHNTTHGVTGAGTGAGERALGAKDQVVGALTGDRAQIHQGKLISMLFTLPSPRPNFFIPPSSFFGFDAKQHDTHGSIIGNARQHHGAAAEHGTHIHGPTGIGSTL